MTFQPLESDGFVGGGGGGGPDLATDDLTGGGGPPLIPIPQVTQIEKHVPAQRLLTRIARTRARRRRDRFQAPDYLKLNPGPNPGGDKRRGQRRRLQRRLQRRRRRYECAICEWGYSYSTAVTGAMGTRRTLFQCSTEVQMFNDIMLFDEDEIDDEALYQSMADFWNESVYKKALGLDPDSEIPRITPSQVQYHYDNCRKSNDIRTLRRMVRQGEDIMNVLLMTGIYRKIVSDSPDDRQSSISLPLSSGRRAGGRESEHEEGESIELGSDDTDDDDDDDDESLFSSGGDDDDDDDNETMDEGDSDLGEGVEGEHPVPPPYDASTQLGKEELQLKPVRRQASRAGPTSSSTSADRISHRVVDVARSSSSRVPLSMDDDLHSINVEDIFVDSRSVATWNQVSRTVRDSIQLIHRLKQDRTAAIARRVGIEITANRTSRFGQSTSRPPVMIRMLKGSAQGGGGGNASSAITTLKRNQGNATVKIPSQHRDGKMSSF